MLTGKKGQMKLVKILIALIIVGIALVLVFKLWNMVTDVMMPGAGVDDESAASMDLLADSVELLLLSPEDYAAIDFLFYIPDGRMLVGWDSGSYENFRIKNMDQCINKEAWKPEQCGDDACICLYETALGYWEKDKRDEHIVICKTFPIDEKESIKFVSHYRDIEKDVEKLVLVYLSEEPRSTGSKREDVKTNDPVIEKYPHSYLSIIGGDQKHLEFIPETCRDWTLSLVRSWGVQDVYLEKRVVEINGKKTHLFYLDKVSDETEERRKFLQTCPTSSLCGCDGLYHDEVFTLTEECEGYDAGTQIACVYDNQDLSCKPQQVNDCSFGVPLIYEDEPCNCGGMMYDRGFCNTKDEEKGQHEFTAYTPVYTYTSVDDCDRVLEKAECSAYRGENNCVLNSCGLEKSCVPLYSGNDYVCGECPSPGSQGMFSFLFAKVRCGDNSCECKDYIKKWIRDQDPCGFDSNPVVEGCQTAQ